MFSSYNLFPYTHRHRDSVLYHLIPKWFANNHIHRWQLAIITWLILGSGLADAQVLKGIASWPYQIVERHPHDSSLFTQGLQVDGDSMIESSGLYGQSLVRRYKKASGKIEAEFRLPHHFFAEGIAQVDSSLWLITWREQQAWRLDVHQLTPINTVHYQVEGWGLTRVTDYLGQSRLLMSNGSSTLSWRSTTTFDELDQLAVHANNNPVTRLNDLTYGAGLIWANIWHQDDIIAIAPDSGEVIGKLNLKKVSRKNRRGSRNVLNGIAWDEEKNGLWLTGKHWPTRYLLEIDIPATKH